MLCVYCSKFWYDRHNNYHQNSQAYIPTNDQIAAISGFNVNIVDSTSHKKQNSTYQGCH